MTTESEVLGGMDKKTHNAHIEKVAALESKFFELVKQESPNDYSAFEVLTAIQLLRQRLIGISGLVASAQVLVQRDATQAQSNL